MSETLPDALLEAVRALRVADTDLGQKPLLAKLREQQPDLGAGTREVREALTALKAESEASARSKNDHCFGFSCFITPSCTAFLKTKIVSVVLVISGIAVA